MFIISIKFNKQKFLMGLIIVVIIAVILGVGYYVVSNRRIEQLPIPSSKTEVEQINDRDFIEYIENFGWKVDPKHREFETFKIPEQFNTTFKRYNQYQRDIGEDITPYLGKEVTRYTYKVRNYNNPSQYQGQQVYADVIVYDGKIIAGDLKTNEANGFMVSLKGRSFKEITGIDENMFK